LKKYLVTGGAGFIGSHFIESLLSQEKDILIYNLDKLTYAGKFENMPFFGDKRHVFIRGDICNQHLVSQLFSSYNFDVVVNFAAESHVDNSINEPSIFMQSNIIGVVNLLNNAKNYWRDLSNHLFVQISTDEVYGSLGDDGLFDEDSIIKPNSPYASSKASADLIALSYYKTYGLPVMITRSSNNYGPRQDSEKLIPKVVINTLSNKKIPIYGDGSNIRDWIFVKDNCNAIINLIKQRRIGEVYNIGGGNERSNLEIVRLILTKLNSSSDLIEYVEDRLGHDTRYAINDKKVVNEIGAYRSMDFDIGLETTIKYFKNTYKLLDMKKNN
jgi:dTDP-glucose 4,6-dehydratase